MLAWIWRHLTYIILLIAGIICNWLLLSLSMPNVDGVSILWGIFILDGSLWAAVVTYGLSLRHSQRPIADFTGMVLLFLITATWTCLAFVYGPGVIGFS